MEMMLSRLSEVELEQVMLSLGAGCIGGKEEIDPLWYRDVFTIDEQGRTVIKITAHLHHVLLGPRVKAYMARPAARPERISADDDKSNTCADCGASITITVFLANTTDILRHSGEDRHSGHGAVIVDMAESGASMEATHSCM